MFIVQSDQVKYCVLSSRMTDSLQPVPGLEYQKKLYIKGTTYDQKNRDFALQEARNKLLENNGNVTLLVDAGETITLWHRDKSAYKVNSALTIDLPKLVTAMRNVGGLSIKERSFRLKSYPQCFVGREAVDWLVSHLEVSRQEAVAIGQRLVKENWIHHVVDEQSFQDDYFFYRFRWDEQ